MELLSGAEMVVRSLRDEGVKYIYGYPGGAVLHIYDALFKEKAIEHILVRHEQAATHMADGYARATGKAGVVLVTSGPGATNAITGIATAFMDSIPMVVISGQVPSTMVGTDAFQETDMIGISRPIVKHSFMIKHPSEIPEVMKKAFYLAESGRPGPVVIDIPKDMTNPAEKFEYVYPKKAKLRSYSPAVRGHSGQIRKAAELLLGAKRPIIYAGGGVILGKASAQLTELAKMLNLPVTNALMGLGCYPGSDRQFVGMLGMHGSYTANLTMHHADVILAVGARFDDRVINGETAAKFCPNAKVIHIDIDPSSINKNIRVDVPIIGDCGNVLGDLLQVFKAEAKKPDIKAWWQQIAQWRARNSLSYRKNNDIILPQYAIQRLFELTRGKDTYITTEVGQHQMWAAQFFGFEEPHRWMTSGGLGTMGYGLPAAVGVQVAHPDSLVIDIAGDASVQMTIQEMSTAVQFELPIKIFILNNQYMGMVRQWQQLLHGNRLSHSYSEALPDFVKLADAYGCVGLQATKPSDLDGAIKEMIAIKRPVLFDCRVAALENCFPMIPSGKAHNEMLLPEEATDEATAKAFSGGKALV